jgi:hypothetical protein
MSERRMVDVQLQRWRPELTTVVVAVPVGWTDEEVKKHLSDIYEKADPDGHSWRDQDDFDPREGDHELTGESGDDARSDLVYPSEDEDADAAE